MQLSPPAWMLSLSLSSMLEPQAASHYRTRRAQNEDSQADRNLHTGHNARTNADSPPGVARM